jgi:hypothetical protein
MTNEQKSREIVKENLRSEESGESIIDAITAALNAKDAQIKEWQSTSIEWKNYCEKLSEQVAIKDAQLKVMREDLETSVNEAERLWKMIDDVSTASDIFKPEQNNYYRGVENAIKGYMSTIKSDGYNLKWSPRAALEEHKKATCQHVAVDGDICCKCGLRVERIGDKYIISKEQV